MDFRSYCHVHFAVNTLNTDQSHEPEELCAICALPMGEFDQIKSFKLVCCSSDSWYHKQCLKQIAFAQKDKFQCPQSCENEVEFRDNMLSNGIFIPDEKYLTEEVAETECQPKAKRRRVHNDWKFVATFESKIDAVAAVKEEKCWSYSYENKSNSGVKVHYRCNLMKFRGKQCAAAVYLLYDSTNNSIHLYRTEAIHTHDDEENKENAVNKICGEVEAEIRKLFEQKRAPKAILYDLVRQGLKAPSKSMLTTFLTKLRREKFGSQKLHYGSLEKWLKESSEIPLSDDQPFVISHVVNVNDNNPEDSKFRFVVSTKRLLQNSIGCHHIHADATYKLVWQGFPILILGTTDNNRKFHPFVSCVSTNERSDDFKFIFKSLKDSVNDLFDAVVDPRILIKDAAESISNGFIAVYPHRNKEENVAMCWAHLRRATSKKLPEFLSDTKQQNEFLCKLFIQSIEINGY